MNQLKYLGKPAPEYIGCCGNGEYCNERTGDKDCPCEAKIQSLEGAIKEATFLLTKQNNLWPKDAQLDWSIRPNRRNSPIKNFVAHLLRKTIGERT